VLLEKVAVGLSSQFVVILWSDTEPQDKFQYNEAHKTETQESNIWTFNICRLVVLKRAVHIRKHFEKIGKANNVKSSSFCP
jgi:uncharacterized protein YegL